MHWRVHRNGDFQASTVIRDTVYLGGHFACVRTISCYDKNADGTPNKTGDASGITIAAFPYGSSVNPPADPDWAPAPGTR